MKHLITLAFIFFVFKPISSQDLNTNLDFDLVRSLELVLKNHKLIEASKIDSKAAEFRVKQSKGAYYPSLDVTANYGHERIIKHGPTNDTQLVARDATAKITQTITDFGLRESTVKTSELSLKQSLALEKQIKNDLLLRALTAYLRVIQSRESVKYAVQSVANIKKQTELEDAAVSAGGGLTSDVLQAKTQLAGAQARLIQFEGVLDAAKHEFEYLYGFFPKNLNDLKLTKSITDQLPQSIEETVENTMKNNPSLIAARITEDIGKEAINTARSSLFPTIKGILSHSEKQDFGGIVGFKRESSAKIDFSYPLNLSFSEYAGKDAAVESYLATSTRIRDQENMIKQMVRTTWDGLDTAQKNAEFLTNQARISGEFLELARKERKAGNRTLLDVLGGETALINAQADAIAAKIEVLINSYTLLSLMGGLTLDTIDLVAD
jgi:adhesin transport system outer membrane protein|tara:strand:- start:172 stop:1482 length:1311 start_codon:yes stop_codon:yes gene_type:complete